MSGLFFFNLVLETRTQGLTVLVSFLSVWKVSEKNDQIGTLTQLALCCCEGHCDGRGLPRYWGCQAGPCSRSPGAADAAHRLPSRSWPFLLLRPTNLGMGFSAVGRAPTPISNPGTAPWMCDPSSCSVRADLFRVTHPRSVSGQQESSYDRMESALLLVQVLKFFLYVYGLFAFMFMCSTCWPGACRGQKRMLDPRSCLWLSALCGCLFLPL